MNPKKLLIALMTIAGLCASAGPALADDGSGAEAVIVDAAVVAPAPDVSITIKDPVPATVPQPDVLDHPTEAVTAVQEVKKNTGVTAAILYGLFLLGRTIGRRNGPGSFLGKGARGALVFAGTGLAAVWMCVLMKNVDLFTAIVDSILYGGMAMQALAHPHLAPPPEKKA